MAKLPWMKWFPADWLNDPKLSLCSASTRGIWADLISSMHVADQSGTLAGTVEQLARFGRCSASEMAAALDELAQTGAADVTKKRAVVTVINRKMSREFLKRQSDAARQLRSRSRRMSRPLSQSNPPEKTEDRRQKTDNTYKNPSSRRGATRPAKSPGGSARASGVRVDLSEEVLADPLRLAQWAEEEAGRSDGWISSSEADRANVVATAAKALRATGLRSRVGLFKWIVRGRRWEYLRFADEEIAATIIAAESTKERASISEFVEIPKFELPKDAQPASNIEAIRRAAGKR